MSVREDGTQAGYLSFPGALSKGARFASFNSNIAVADHNTNDQQAYLRRLGE